MSIIQYLQDLISDQSIPTQGLNEMRNDRDKIEKVLLSLDNLPHPTFYYGGSFGKDMIIADAYDLDIVCYYPNDIQWSVRDLYFKILAQLQRKFQDDYNVHPKNVSIRIEKREDYHIDVVPGKRLPKNEEDAWLYKNKTGQRFRTSVKKHIRIIKDCGRRDVLKILKLWKLRNLLEIPSFLLELIGIRVLEAQREGISLDQAAMAAWQFIADQMLQITIKDPANLENILTDEEVITVSQKKRIIRVAKWTLQLANHGSKNNWERIFRKKPEGFQFNLGATPSSSFPSKNPNQDQSKTSDQPRLSPDSPNRRFAQF